MVRLIPPLDPEPPTDYVAFVGRHLPTLPGEAARLVGGHRYAEEIYPEALTDVAARWGWFERLGPLAGPDASTTYLRRTLAQRAKQWRDEQPYPVEVHALPLRPPPPPAQRIATPGWASIALRRAPMLPDTARREARPVAEAAIAWWHAYERRRRRRLVALGIMVIFGFALILRLADALAAV